MYRAGASFDRPDLEQDPVKDTGIDVVLIEGTRYASLVYVVEAAGRLVFEFLASSAKDAVRGNDGNSR